LDNNCPEEGIKIMSEFKSKNVAITGAAGGIGQELSSHFGNLGATILAIDKNESVSGIFQKIGG
jgi:NAD(P)-dependent dehydrogenase (short-subunit alcohol dehydrogenase family)